jgi:ankyrin repeat protein
VVASQSAPASAPADSAASVPAPDELYRAAESGDLAKLKTVLEGNVDVNALDPKGHSALILAIQRQHLNAVKMLLAHGADPKKPDGHGATPMSAAYSSGYYDMIQAIQRSTRR